jgi:hypothetical protein
LVANAFIMQSPRAWRSGLTMRISRGLGCLHSPILALALNGFFVYYLGVT